ncbi:hypothetical protein [Hymenobacter properus]|uniref:Alpha/beta hydrolase n=1 Tax=Hymenobacter properus TaxID=2791026 RepID=A0A931BKQ9_9BACT|nr:hypothetical protein [Hymenobacter properus]MBF9143231.1 hypothetical protein [Hymenobacter properus]MBR7722041.1 hypothetical protein [Microvirga sp. SRT04]
MPIPALLRLLKGRATGLRTALALLAAAACQPQHDAASNPTPPPVGHYEGSLAQAGRPDVRAALDIRHPSPGHYEAELTVPTAPGLSFVADTVVFGDKQLRLTRPARPGQRLTLTAEGDFWRGTLEVDSAKATTVLLKRGSPSPSTYHVEEVPQGNGSAWLFAPADVSTLGPVLALLPDSATAVAAPLWADALAREGVIVLVLPMAHSATPETETPRLQKALRLLHNTPGADTAHVGLWAAGPRAAALAQALAAPGGPRAAYLIAQNLVVDPVTRAAIRELKDRKVPLLSLHGGASATTQAATLRNAVGGRRGATVRTYRQAGTNLLVAGDLGPQLAPGVPAEVLEWLRQQ